MRKQKIWHRIAGELIVVGSLATILVVLVSVSALLLRWVF